jgi:hypothetical protein
VSFRMIVFPTTIVILNLSVWRGSKSVDAIIISSPIFQSTASTTVIVFAFLETEADNLVHVGVLPVACASHLDLSTNWI